MSDINIELVQKRLVVVLYFSEIMMTNLSATINEAEREQNILIEMFNYQFYQEVYTQLEKKSAIFKLYLEDLQDMKKAFDEQIAMGEQITLNEKEIAYEELLIHAIAEVSILIKKLEIEQNEMMKKKERKDEKNTKNSNGTLLNY